jgi:hypothetical protein
MNQDEIIEMARAAGFVEYELDDGTTTAFDKRYEAFAKLVAQEVRDRIMFGSRDDWVLAEREACAKVCEKYAAANTSWTKAAVKDCAAIIKARGKQA